MTIAAEKRITNDIVVPSSFASRYAWNSARIDGIDILSSFPAIVRELPFPLDINLNVVPNMIQNNDHTELDYLKLTNSPHRFSSSILKTLIEDRRTTHVERINNIRNLIVLQPVISSWLEQLFKVISPRIKLLSCVTLFETLTKSSVSQVMVVILLGKWINLTALNLISWLMIYIIFSRLLNLVNLSIHPTRVVWTKFMFHLLTL